MGKLKHLIFISEMFAISTFISCTKKETNKKAYDLNVNENHINPIGFYDQTKQQCIFNQSSTGRILF